MTGSDIDKMDSNVTAAPIQHVEKSGDHGHTLQDLGYAADASQLPKGYFTSFYFLGTIFAVGTNLLSSTAGFALIAPVLGEIDVALGPSTQIIWVALVYTLGLALGLTLVGRLTDIFGRRWFFIVGCLLGCLGAIVCSTAHSIPTLIGGETLIGLSAATGYSYAFVSGELVPVKYRFIVNSIIFCFSIPFAGFGAAVSTALILYTSAGWRWCYYLLIIANALAALAYTIFYYPPDFQRKHGADSKMKWVKNFDYIGTLLYVAGLLLFIMGLSLGGSLYPWKSAAVICLIVIGVFCLIALFVYESKANLQEPLIPMHLFRNREWVFSALLLSLGASVYYSQAIVWPQMTVNVYANGRSMWAGWVGSLVGLGITIGEIIGGSVAKQIRYTKFQCMCAITLGTVFLGSMATCTVDTPKTAIALVFIASLAVGYNESLALPFCIICIPDQQEIGVAAGIAGSMRSAISAVASAVYSVVLTNRVTATIPAEVPPKVIAAGLPASSVAAYMEAIAAGGSPKLLAAVKGLTPQILAVGARAYQVAYTDAYRTIFLVSLAFGGLAMICACFTPMIDLKNEAIAATLHKRGEEGDVAAVPEQHLVREVKV